MKRIVLCLLLLPLCLALSPSAWASWGTFISPPELVPELVFRLAPMFQLTTSSVPCGAARPPSW